MPSIPSLFRAGTAALVLLAAPAAAEPALWKVSDADTTVWLLGTMHMLPPESGWRSPAIADAFDAADTLWLEVDIVADNSGGMALLAKGTSPDRPLSSRLTPDEYAEVEAAAAKAGVRMVEIERLRPWLAGISIMAGSIRAAGYREAGVDMELAFDADMRGLEIHGLETGAEQIDLLATLPEDLEKAMLMQTVRLLDEGTEAVRYMYAAWRDGDLAELERLLVESFKETEPLLVDRLLGERNRKWAARFEEIMAEPGTAFVAVGAGHLVGEDALPDLLAAKGWTVERADGP